MHHVHTLFALPITMSFEGRDRIAKRLLELILWPECQPANPRMQAVRANDNVKLAVAFSFESDADMIGFLSQLDHLVVKNHRA